MDWRLEPSEYLPGPPADTDVAAFGIGLVGCGGIANGAHLPAFRKAGYRVVACCDVVEAAARGTAERWGIPFWTTDVRALLARPEVKIIDMPLHPAARLDVLREIATAPRPVLSQKPLHMELARARELAAFAAEAGIPLAVNQQARWVPGHRALRLLMDRGAVGQVYAIHHLIRSFQDQADTWSRTLPNFNIADHGVHYLDLCRYFAASPAAGRLEWERLHCTTAMLPDQLAVDPLIYSINVEFGPAGGRERLMASLQFNNVLRARQAHGYTWWIDGGEGSMWLTQGAGGSGWAGHVLHLARADEPDVVHDMQIEGNWFPDAFQGPIGDLMSAVAHGREPAVTPRDNLHTVAMTTAAVLSSREGRVVQRDEVMGSGG